MKLIPAYILAALLMIDGASSIGTALTFIGRDLTAVIVLLIGGIFYMGVSIFLLRNLLTKKEL